MSDSQPTIPTLASRLVSIRQKLIGRGMYLGTDSVRDNVRWQRLGRADHVVKIATLSAIVKISSSAFYLTSDANYRPGGKVYKHLSQVRPSCICEAPSIEPFKSDFEHVLENLRWLQQQATTAGFTARAGLFPSIPNCFKVRHVLFEEKRATDNDDETESAASAFTIKNWPVNTAAEEELEGMKETHTVVPIPAYGMSGELINPQSYRNQLEGALVEIKFNLLHWSIAAKKSAADNAGNLEGADTYVADLDQIWVVAPPTAIPSSSPRKRKVPDTIDTDLATVSPTKKRS
ncbi:hypothetical protein EDD15DRAFT_2162451 [Pisolithus albus]|nr:hypothetical protein EDD15DRAFT_2162451 [Pisolithus albus]